MPYPSEPDKVIYNGLTSLQLYNHYIENKAKIIKECDRRPVLLFNKYDGTKDFTVVRLNNSSPIILTSSNYENIITGYTVSISVESQYPGKMLKQKIIDIDHNGATEKELKECIKSLHEFYKAYKRYITNSSTGYHFRVDFGKHEYSKLLTQTYRELKAEFSDRYLINSRSRNPSKGSINLDLVGMQHRGSLTVPYGLNRNGTRCIYISNNNLDKFDRATTYLRN